MAPESANWRFDPRRCTGIAGRALICLVLWSAAPAWAAEASDAGPAPETFDSASCSSCHAALLDKKVKHALFDSSGCESCHAPKPGGGKCKSEISGGWKLTADDPALCAQCHDMKSKTAMHPAIDSGGCGACHDPHASDNPAHLKQPVTELCYGCHDRKDDKKEVHTALKKGDCIGCHNPHSGEADPLLAKPREQLCFKCHKPEVLLAGASHHAPAVEGQCLACHEPHSSNFKKQTRADGNELCLKCHDAKAKPGPNVPGPALRIDLDKPTSHPALDAAGCQGCHKPHASEQPRLQQKPTAELCYDCHDRKDDQHYVHGAVKLGDCGVCHSPHTTDTKTLLRQDTPAQLCFQCHQDDVTGRESVHKPVRDGNCTACHGPHGAKNPNNLTAGQGKQACYACHKPKDDVKVKHKALERYGCAACHDPHGTANKFQLIKPTNELCQSCHQDKKDGMHVMTFGGSAHKVSGGVDPRRLDRDFSCASCHNPHGSDNPKLFYFGASGTEMCDGCHGDRMGGHPELKDIHNAKRPLTWKPPEPGGSLLPGPDGGAPPALSVPPTHWSLVPPPDAGPPPRGALDTDGGLPSATSPSTGAAPTASLEVVP